MKCPDLCGMNVPEGHPNEVIKTKLFLVEILINTQLPEDEQEMEVKARLMTVSGVKSVKEVQP